jgi:hypothetical protein
MWQIPTVAVSIMAGIVVAAHQSGIESWPRIGVPAAGSIFLFALGLEVIPVMF